MASTKSYFKEHSHETCISFNQTIDTISHFDSVYEYGTSYNIILPLDKNIGLDENFMGNEIAKELNFSAKNYYELLKYKYVKEESRLVKTEMNVLFQVNIKSFVEGFCADLFL